MSNLHEIIDFIIDELQSAQEKYPEWPNDIIHQVAIMNEESGEAIRAAINHFYHGEDVKYLEKELIQTAAMTLRCLLHIQEIKD